MEEQPISSLGEHHKEKPEGIKERFKRKVKDLAILTSLNKNIEKPANNENKELEGLDEQSNNVQAKHSPGLNEIRMSNKMINTKSDEGQKLLHLMSLSKDKLDSIKVEMDTLNLMHTKPKLSKSETLKTSIKKDSLFEIENKQLSIDFSNQENDAESSPIFSNRLIDTEVRMSTLDHIEDEKNEDVDYSCFQTAEEGPDTINEVITEDIQPILKSRVKEEVNKDIEEINESKNEDIKELNLLITDAIENKKQEVKECKKASKGVPTIERLVQIEAIKPQVVAELSIKPQTNKLQYMNVFTLNLKRKDTIPPSYNTARELHPVAYDDFIEYRIRTPHKRKERHRKIIAIYSESEDSDENDSVKSVRPKDHYKACSKKRKKAERKELDKKLEGKIKAAYYKIGRVLKRLGVRKLLEDYKCKRYRAALTITKAVKRWNEQRKKERLINRYMNHCATIIQRYYRERCLKMNDDVLNKLDEVDKEACLFSDERPINPLKNTEYDIDAALASETTTDNKPESSLPINKKQFLRRKLVYDPLKAIEESKIAQETIKKYEVDKSVPLTLADTEEKEIVKRSYLKRKSKKVRPQNLDWNNVSSRIDCWNIMQKSLDGTSISFSNKSQALLRSPHESLDKSQSREIFSFEQQSERLSVVEIIKLYAECHGDNPSKYKG